MSVRMVEKPPTVGGHPCVEIVGDTREEVVAKAREWTHDFKAYTAVTEPPFQHADGSWIVTGERWPNC